MTEPHDNTRRAWTWRHAFATSQLPATTKAVLHTLGMFMNEMGESCYPSVVEICRYSGLDKKTVLKHLGVAREAGWIAVSQHGFRGQRWKRQEYAARWPERDLVAACAPDGSYEGGGNTPPPSEVVKVVDFVPEGGGIEGIKVVEQVHQDKNSPINIPNTSPMERGARANGKTENEKDPASLPPEDNPNSAAFKKRVAQFCNGTGFVAGAWKDWDVGAALDWIVKRFANLTPEERLQAESWRDAYLLDVVSRKKNPQAVGNFLRDRTWTALDPEILKRVETVKVQASKSEERKPDGWAKCLGPVGLARMFAHFLEGPADAELARSSFLPKSLLAKAWPAIARFRDIQQQRGGTVFQTQWHVAASLMEPVLQDTAMLEAWKDEFSRRAWPWPGEFDRLPVVYCPKGGPSALVDFEAALRGLVDDGN